MISARAHALELLGLALSVEAREVVREDHAREEIQARCEHHLADVHRGALTRQVADVIHELAHLLAPDVVERVEPVRREAANSSAAMVLLSARHRCPLGSQGTEFLACSPVASGTEREAKTASCFCRNSRATSGEETTTVVTAPRRRDMSGPWVLARMARER